MVDINQLPQHQNTADYLKGIALGINAPGLKPLRQRVLSMIKIFERTGFHKQGFLHVFEKINPPLIIAEGKITRQPGAEDRDVLEGIAELLDGHLTIADPNPREVFTSSSAAEYLNLTVDGINYHQKMGNLVGRMLGHTRIYTKDELEHFTTHKRSAGRPKQKPVEN